MRRPLEERGYVHKLPSGLEEFSRLQRTLIVATPWQRTVCLLGVNAEDNCTWNNRVTAGSDSYIPLVELSGFSYSCKVKGFKFQRRFTS